MHLNKFFISISIVIGLILFNSCSVLETQLNISSPLDESSINNKTFSIEGTVSKNAKIQVDSHDIEADTSNGNFKINVEFTNLPTYPETEVKQTFMITAKSGYKKEALEAVTLTRVLTEEEQQAQFQALYKQTQDNYDPIMGESTPLDYEKVASDLLKYENQIVDFRARIFNIDKSTGDYVTIQTMTDLTGENNQIIVVVPNESDYGMEIGDFVHIWAEILNETCYKASSGDQICAPLVNALIVKKD